MHSGINEAYSVCEHVCDEVLDDGLMFRSNYIYGPKGCGKTHLIEGFKDKLIANGYDANRVVVIRLEDNPNEETVSAIVAKYESLRVGGGVLFFESVSHPSSISDNPHLVSRLLAGELSELYYPKELELKPLLASIAERRNLLLSEATIEYLTKRVGLNPLSFDAILARLNEVSLAEGKAPGPKVLRSILDAELGATNRE